ncbi:unnamed protein product, partial [Durusdinium trenchii]
VVDLKKISHAVLQHRQLGRAALWCSFGDVVSNRETVLVMELLDDLMQTYTSRNLWHNEDMVRLDVAYVVDDALQHIHQQK